MSIRRLVSLLLAVALGGGNAARGAAQAPPRVLPEHVTEPTVDTPLGRARFLRRLPAPPAPAPPGQGAALGYPAQDLGVDLDPVAGTVSATALVTVVGQLAQGTATFYVLLDRGLTITEITASGGIIAAYSQDDYPPFNYVTVTLDPAPAVGETVTLSMRWSGTLQCLASGARGNRYCSLEGDLQHFENAGPFPMIYDKRDPYGMYLTRRTLTLRIPEPESGERDVLVSADFVSETSQDGTRISRWVADPLSSRMVFMAVVGDLTALQVSGPAPPFTVYHVAGQPDWAADMVAWEQVIVPFLDAQAGAPLPFGQVGVIKLPPIDGFPGTASYGMVYLADDYADLGAESFEETLAHETSHLWWGVLAYPSDNTMWLVEGLAVLSQYDYTWAAHRAAQASTDDAARAVARDRYQAGRYHWNRLLLQYLTDPETLPALVLPAGASMPDTVTPYTVWAYFKSSATLDHLRAGLGPDVFADGLRRYRAACALADCETADFLIAMQDAVSAAVARGDTRPLPESFDAFASQWVDGTAYVDLQVAFTQTPVPDPADPNATQRWDVTVTLEQRDARTGTLSTWQVPVELWLVTDDDQVERHLVWLRESTATFVLPTAGAAPVRLVRPNPRHDAILWSRSAQQGDVDFDQAVDGFDLVQCARREGRHAVTDPSRSIYGVDLGFEPRCDLTGDGVIDASDLAVQQARFGQGVQP